MRGVGRGLQAAVLNNASAYGYSVLITATFGVVQVQAGSPRVGDVFLFAGGASVAFAIVDLLAALGFRERVRSEPPQVVVLGSALSFFSVGLSLGAAALLGTAVDGWAAWLACPFAASLVYPLIVAVELVAAYELEARRED